MPTDGTDFARMKACYGKFYTATKQGVAEADLASIALEGLARDLRRDGGLAAFRPLIDLLRNTLAPGLLSSNDKGGQLLDGVERIERQYADSSLTREACAAARTVGLKELNCASLPCMDNVMAQMVVELIKTRCLDRASPYATRHRTHSIQGTQQLNGEIAQAAFPEARILADAIYNSPKGTPSRQWNGRVAPIEHTAAALENEVICQLCK